MSYWDAIFGAAPHHTLKAGDTLFRQNDPVRFLYFVRSGIVALERPLPDGAPLTLQRATDGMALAEASLFSEAYHCDAIARSDATLAVLPRRAVLAALEASPKVALKLIEAQSRNVQAQRARIEILRLRRVSERLDAWLALHEAPRQGEWVQVAEQIGVSPPALYRELARRRD